MDPGTIAVVIGGAKALKSAFEMAKDAMDEFRACADAGMDAKDSFGALINVFTAHGEVQKHVNEAKKAKPEPAPVTEDGSPAKPAPKRKKNATAQALEAMKIERELRDQEEEIKNFLIYRCNEAGLYEDLCRKRDAIINADREAEEAERRAAMEARLAEKAKEMEKRRIRRRRLDVIENAIGMVVVLAIIYGFYVSMRWMLAQGTY